jgi:hypothetical protein
VAASRRVTDKPGSALINQAVPTVGADHRRRSPSRSVVRPLAQLRVLDRAVADDHDALLAYGISGFW